MNRKFELGQTVVTAAIDKRMNIDHNFAAFVQLSLDKQTFDELAERYRVLIS